jgi:amino acid transporter
MNSTQLENATGLSDSAAASKTFGRRLRGLFLGEAKDPLAHDVFHRVSLAAFLAWVGLGSDGLSSSCYGPEEAFLALGTHTFLALVLAGLMVVTVLVISASYTQIIEQFPTGGGGYLVATKLLGQYPGLVAGGALLVDYVLTISISIASGSDAIFSFLPLGFQPYKLVFAGTAIGLLTVLNLRGVRESVIVLVPIFAAFLLTHTFVVVYGLLGHAGSAPEVVSASWNESVGGVREGGAAGAGADPVACV